MSTTELLFKVTANARSAVAGLRPLEASLKDIKSESEKAEQSLDGLAKDHKVDIDDDAIGRTKKEMTRLREQMRHDLSVDVNADTRETQRKISGLRRTLRELDRKDVDVKVKLDVDEKGLDGLGKAGGGGKLAGLAGLGGILGKVGPAALGIGAAAGGVALVAGGIAKIGAESLKLADQMANAKIAFTQFLGTGAKADTFLQGLSKFAAKTPFEFPELVDASKKLLAFGLNSKDVIPIMTTLGDAAALTGSNVSDLADIWGQMKAKGKVANEELLQLTERGIPAYQILSDKMGLPVSKIQDMASKGKLLAKDTLPLLQQGLNKTFGGGMAKQAQTLSGKMSTLKDTVSGFGRSFGAALTPMANALLDKVMPALTKVGDWLDTHKGAIANALMAGGAGLLDYLAGATDAIGFMVDSLVPFAQGLDSISGKIGDFLIKIGGLVNAANKIPGVGRGIPDDLGDSLVSAGGKVKGFGDDITKGLGKASETIHGAADGMRKGADNMRVAGKKMADSFKGSDITAEINQVKGHLAELAKKPPSPKVDADIRAAQKKLARLRKERREWAKGQATAKLDANIDKAKTKLKTIKNSLAYLRKQKPTPEIRAKIKDWQRRYKTVQADLRKLRRAKHDVKITPKTDKAAAKKTNKEIDKVARNRTTIINIKTRGNKVYDQLNRNAPSTQAVPGTIVPQLFGASGPMLRAAATALGTPAARMGPGAGVPANVAQQAAGGPGGGSHTRLAPRQTPVQVLLDGAVIADRLDLRRSLAATESVRRTA